MGFLNPACRFISGAGSLWVYCHTVINLWNTVCLERSQKHSKLLCCAHVVGERERKGGGTITNNTGDCDGVKKEPRKPTGQL